MERRLSCYIMQKSHTGIFPNNGQRLSLRPCEKSGLVEKSLGRTGVDLIKDLMKIVRDSNTYWRKKFHMFRQYGPFRLRSPAWGIVHHHQEMCFMLYENRTSHTKNCFKGLPILFPHIIWIVTNRCCGNIQTKSQITPFHWSHLSLTI